MNKLKVRETVKEREMNMLKERETRRGIER